MAAAPCGTRTRYVAGCRCQPCTIANRNYAREWERHKRRMTYGIETHVEHLVDATEAREHLQWLSSKGVGSIRVRSVTKMSRSNIVLIRQGRRTKITQRTAQRILAVGLHRFTRKPAS